MGHYQLFFHVFPCFSQKHHGTTASLVTSFCQILPPHPKVHERYKDASEISEFKDSEPVECSQNGLLISTVNQPVASSNVYSNSMGSLKV